MDIEIGDRLKHSKVGWISTVIDIELPVLVVEIRHPHRRNFHWLENWTYDNTMRRIETGEYIKLHRPS